jgi:hypothetical protein
MLYTWAGRSFIYSQLGIVILDPSKTNLAAFWMGVTILCVSAITLLCSPFLKNPFPKNVDIKQVNALEKVTTVADHELTEIPSKPTPVHLRAEADGLAR